LIEFNRLGKNSNREKTAKVVTSSRYTENRSGLIVRRAVVNHGCRRILDVTRRLSAISAEKTRTPAEPTPESLHLQGVMEKALAVSLIGKASGVA
jgi:hypothetical protein